MNIKVRSTPRTDDEIVIAAIRLRAAGHGSAAIGEALGFKPEHIRTITNRVIDADLAESGEPMDAVLAAYWWRGDGPKLGLRAPCDGPMKTTHDIIETIGRPRIRAAFGVKDRVIQMYLASGKLPASWFDSLERMTGQTLPRALFSFKGDPQ